jgi:serine/threonine protein kinase
MLVSSHQLLQQPPMLRRFTIRMSSKSHDVPTKSYSIMTPPGATLLAIGGSSAIFTYPDRPNEVSKRPYNAAPFIKHFEIEKRVYHRLECHPNIIGYLSINADAIRLERAQYNYIRQFYREDYTASLKEQIKWSRDLANAVQYIHSKNVLLDAK